MIASYVPRPPHHHAKPCRRPGRVAAALTWAGRALLDIALFDFGLDSPHRPAHAA